MEWQPHQPIPPALLAIDAENKEKVTDLLLTSSVWTSFLFSTKGDDIKVIGSEAEKNLKRLEKPIKLPKYQHNYYAVLIDEIRSVQLDPNTEWQTIQTLLLKWDTVKEAIPNEHHACLTEIMDYYLKHPKQEFMKDNLEMARQQVKEYVKQEEQSRIKRKLTGEILDQVISNKRKQLGGGEMLNEQEIGELISLLQDSRPTKKQSLALQKSAQMDPLLLQQSLLRSKHWNDFLGGLPSSNKFEKEEAELSTRLDHLQYRFNTHETPQTFIPFTRLSYLHQHYAPDERIVYGFRMGLSDFRTDNKTKQCLVSIRTHFQCNAK